VEKNFSFWDRDFIELKLPGRELKKVEVLKLSKDKIKIRWVCI
jgi:bacillopeptidase F (M6 metalloprotease family)